MELPQRHAPKGRFRSGKGQSMRSNGWRRRGAARVETAAWAEAVAERGPRGCLTARSTRATIPARVQTAGLKRLRRRRGSADSAGIEDIPSSMQPKETHHERHPASSLQLRRLFRARLPLRLPARRGTGRFADTLRLRPAVPLRPELLLRQVLNRRASERTLAAGGNLLPAPTRLRRSRPNFNFKRALREHLCSGLSWRHRGCRPHGHH